MLITSSKINSGIGIDIGDGITNFIIKQDSIIPQDNIEKFIIKDFDIKKVIILEGKNNLSKNNIKICELPIEINKLFFINIKIIHSSFIFLSFYDKSNIIFNNIYKINNNNSIIDENININKIKIIYLFEVTKKNIFKKIENNKLLPKIVSDSIKNKLNSIKNNLNNMEVQKIMEKIQLLKDKFLL